METNATATAVMLNLALKTKRLIKPSRLIMEWLRMTTLGKYISTKRNSIPMTQLDLALQVRITTGHMSDIEHNRRFPSDDVLVRIVGILGLDLDYAYYLCGKFPEDLRCTKRIEVVKRAYRIMRNK